MIGECTAMKTIQTDILIVGTGASGLFAALHIPEDKKVLMITKEEVERVILFWLRVESVYCGMSQITTVLWRIR